MNSVIVYASRSGNTRRVAEAMAEALRSEGAVDLHPVGEAPALLPHDVDLVLVGGPTEGHGLTQPMADWILRLDRSSLQDTFVAAFDTRLRWPRLLSGSAAAGIARRLREKGARVIGEEMSFLVTGQPELIPGETERAAAWAREMAETVKNRRASPALV